MPAFLGDRLAAAIYNPDKTSPLAGVGALRNEVVAALTADYEGGEKSARAEGRRQHLRGPGGGHRARAASWSAASAPMAAPSTEIRPIWTEVGYLPRAHGSAIFTRGQTQILSVATLGSPGDAQRLDSISPEDTKHYIHHYNFPPYSTGEAKPLRSAGRREIGHGALAERALVRMLPDRGRLPVHHPRRLRGAVLERLDLDGLASAAARWRCWTRACR